MTASQRPEDGQLKADNTLVVVSMFRLAGDALNTLTGKGIVFALDTENLDTSSSAGKIMTMVIRALGEFENTRQRQREGIDRARAKGKHLGRPRATYPAQWDEIYQMWKQDRITATAAMLQLHLKRTTFYKLVRESRQTA